MINSKYKAKKGRAGSNESSKSKLTQKDTELVNQIAAKHISRYCRDGVIDPSPVKPSEEEKDIQIEPHPIMKSQQFDLKIAKLSIIDEQKELYAFKNMSQHSQDKVEELPEGYVSHDAIFSDAEPSTGNESTKYTKH